ncbi:MAG: hypothetical protein WCE53_05485 [Candidatus Acidiferrum sp.]
MVVILFVVSFMLALALSYGVSKLCKDAVEAIANHFLAKNISAGAAKYLQLAIILVGVSSGTRVRLLEDYISAPAWNKPELAAQLTPELWAIALYHTVVDALLGIAWLLVAFALIAMFVVIAIRRSNMTWLLAGHDEDRPTDNAPRPLKPTP